MTMLSRWSESIYSDDLSSRPDGSSSTFLSQLDACLYEGVPMQEVVLTEEAQQWAARFLHLRVVGKRIMPQTIVTPNIKTQSKKQVTSVHLPAVMSASVVLKSGTDVNTKKEPFPKLKNVQRMAKSKK